MLICDIDKCTGCFACMNICSKQAITVSQDENKCNVPLVDKDKCISCGLCQKICPINKTPELIRAEKSIAAWSKNAEDIGLSSSGGIAAVFSRLVIHRGGVVYGAACDGAVTKHICVECESDLYKLRGSKYVQSEIGYIYRDVNEKLNAGRQVLFIGTPCQIAGLNAYLKKSYDNLITVDLICHGTPPHSYLQEHIDAKCGKNNWDSYSFRGKYNYCLTVYKGDKLIFNRSNMRDEYFAAFMKAVTFRNSCYSCKFARPERAADITIGDFWGLDRSKLKKKYNGRISVVLANTEKGKAFFDSCKALVNWEERNIEEAMNEQQGNLLHPSEYHKDRDQFLREYKICGFNAAVRKTGMWKEAVKSEKKKTIKRIISIPPRMVSKLERILFKEN